MNKSSVIQELIAKHGGHFKAIGVRISKESGQWTPQQKKTANKVKAIRGAIVVDLGKALEEIVRLEDTADKLKEGLQLAVEDLKARLEDPEQKTKLTDIELLKTWTDLINQI